MVTTIPTLPCSCARLVRPRSEGVRVSIELPESVPPPITSSESSPAPSRRTFIATGTAVGCAVVVGGSFLTDPTEAAADQAAPPTSRVSLTVTASGGR
ncbi:twin-arginine translocation signal domain-containing protein [Streptomyces niveus]|uniref:twin-arginine translocation signal domain-containing protein n=1 Tax=Streptomyces niveus TaxID=193462 RepID=UPI00386C9A7F